MNGVFQHGINIIGGDQLARQVVERPTPPGGFVQL
jgi:hypothetical protein